MKNFLRQYGDDILILIGCALLLVGVYQVCPVATWFAAGGLSIAWGIALGVIGGRK